MYIRLIIMQDKTKGTDYSLRALYEVIKQSVLLKDRDLVYFIRTMNDNVLDDFIKIKKNPHLSMVEINKRYENYTIVYMMIKSLLHGIKISDHEIKAVGITNFFLTDELTKKSDKPPSKSIFDDND